MNECQKLLDMKNILLNNRLSPVACRLSLRELIEFALQTRSLQTVLRKIAIVVTQVYGVKNIQNTTIDFLSYKPLETRLVASLEAVVFVKRRCHE